MVCETRPMKTAYEIELDRTEMIIITWICGFTVKERKPRVGPRAESKWVSV